MAEQQVPQQNPAQSAEFALWELMPQRRPLPLRFLSLARRKPLGAISLAIIVFLAFVAIFADVIQTHDPIRTNTRERLLRPGAEHWFGTDQFGRDIFSRIVQGTRISLTVGSLATLLGTFGGSLIGMVSGYFGGRIDMVIQRFMDGVMAFPFLVLLMVLALILGATVTNLIWVLAIAIIPSANRIVRGATLSVKENTYIEAARTIGAGPLRILTFYILPNVAANIIVIASITLGVAILAESGLSFLGLGVKPPTPTWGNMLASDARRYLEQAPYLAWFPGMAITITVLAFNLLGDTLRDILDPRLRGT